MMRRNSVVFMLPTVSFVVLVYYIYLSSLPKISPLFCYRIERNSLPDILDIEPPTEESIFFMETSCRSYVEGKIFITARQACSVESAALNNPAYKVYLMFTSPGLSKDDNTLSDRLLQILINLVNVQVVRLNYSKFFKNTLVEPLYTDGNIESSKFPINTASNIARLLTLSKYGGIYLDLDIITIKSFNNLSSNFAVAESDTHINNAVLRSSINGSGQEFIKLCLEELKNNFVGDEWGYNGPIVATTILKEMCGEDITGMFTRNCSGFTVYPPEKFYPISYEDWRSYFVNNYTQELNYVLENSFGVHVWNKLSKNTLSDSSESVFSIIAKNHCPQVYGLASEFF